MPGAGGEGKGARFLPPAVGARGGNDHGNGWSSSPAQSQSSEGDVQAMHPRDNEFCRRKRCGAGALEFGHLTAKVDYPQRV